MAKPTLITDSLSATNRSPGNGVQAGQENPTPPERPIVTGRQCRAARAMLQWSREDLAERTGIHYITLCNFELGHCALKRANTQLLRLTFQAAGVLLIDGDSSGGPGVCLAKPPG